MDAVDAAPRGGCVLDGEGEMLRDDEKSSESSSIRAMRLDASRRRVMPAKLWLRQFVGWERLSVSSEYANWVTSYLRRLCCFVSRAPYVVIKRVPWIWY